MRSERNGAEFMNRSFARRLIICDFSVRCFDSLLFSRGILIRLYILYATCRIEFGEFYGRVEKSLRNVLVIISLTRSACLSLR